MFYALTLRVVVGFTIVIVSAQLGDTFVHRWFVVSVERSELSDAERRAPARLYRMQRRRSRHRQLATIAVPDE